MSYYSTSQIITKLNLEPSSTYKNSTLSFLCYWCVHLNLSKYGTYPVRVFHAYMLIGGKYIYKTWISNVLRCIVRLHQYFILADSHSRTCRALSVQEQRRNIPVFLPSFYDVYFKDLTEKLVLVLVCQEVCCFLLIPCSPPAVPAIHCFIYLWEPQSHDFSN